MEFVWILTCQTIEDFLSYWVNDHPPIKVFNCSLPKQQGVLAYPWQPSSSSCMRCLVKLALSFHNLLVDFHAMFGELASYSVNYNKTFFVILQKQQQSNLGDRIHFDQKQWLTVQMLIPGIYTTAIRPMIVIPTRVPTGYCLVQNRIQSSSKWTV